MRTTWTENLQATKLFLEIDKRVSTKAAVVSLFCFAVLKVKGPEKRKQGPLDKTERVCRPIELCRKKIFLSLFITKSKPFCVYIYYMDAFKQRLTNTSM